MNVNYFELYFKKKEAIFSTHLCRCLICCFIGFFQDAREEASLFL